MTVERFYDLSQTRLQVLEAGDPSHPLLMLAHGFPEGAYSWRHQIDYFAQRGWHVLAPYLRGYGTSGSPKEVSAYTSEKLSQDLIDLSEATGHKDMVLVGHDWGALIGWDFVRLFPEKLRAYVAVSVPFINWPEVPTKLMKKQHGDRFFYMLYFQNVGAPEEELEKDVRHTMRETLWSISGDGFPQRKPYPEGLHYSQTGFLSLFPQSPSLPWSWLSESDLDRYTADFTASGFFGPVSYYRNLNTNHERVKNIPPATAAMPIYFICGENDLTLVMDRNGIKRMGETFPQFAGATVIPKIGHWTQQEDPRAFNNALENFLATLS